MSGTLTTIELSWLLAEKRETATFAELTFARTSWLVGDGEDIVDVAPETPGSRWMPDDEGTLTLRLSRQEAEAFVTGCQYRTVVGLRPPRR